MLKLSKRNQYLLHVSCRDSSPLNDSVDALVGPAPGAFVDLSFKFSSSDVNGVYIDNVTYIPNGSSVALLALGMALGVRRRR